jgi:hypothetical protein
MIRRRHFERAISLKDQLASYAKVARELASRLPPGPERDDLTERARWADTTFHRVDLPISLHSPK